MPNINAKKIKILLTTFNSPYVFILGGLCVVFYPGFLFLLGVVVLMGLSAWIDRNRFAQYQTMVQQYHQLQYMDQMTQAMRQSRKLSEVLELIIENFVKELHYSRVILYKYVSKKRGYDYLEPVIATGISFETIKEYKFRVDKNIDILPRAVVEQKPFIVHRAAEDYRCDQKFVALIDLKEYVVLPFIIKDQPMGVLLADRQHTDAAIGEEELPVLMIFANQAGLALENARLYNQVEELAITDGLTNLYNRRYFMDALNLELLRIDRYEKKDQVLSLIIIDVDHFKSYNDTYGHAAGDQVLYDLGQILTKALRKVDILARYGGEEFVIMLPVTNKDKAVMLAWRLRAAVQQALFEFGDKQPLGNVTISLGVATYGEDGLTDKDLLAVADQQLYAAKGAGRNRVCFEKKEVTLGDRQEEK